MAAAGLAAWPGCWGLAAAGDGLVYDTTPVSKGSIRKIVSTSGPVRALVTVSVGSQLSGQVDERQGRLQQRGLARRGARHPRRQDVRRQGRPGEGRSGSSRSGRSTTRKPRSSRRKPCSKLADPQQGSPGFSRREGLLGTVGARLRQPRQRGRQSRHRGFQGADRQRQGDDPAAQGGARSGAHRSRAHQHPLAHRRHRDLAHRRSRPDRGGEPAGARAVQDRPGSLAHSHRGAGQRSRRRRGQRGQSGDVHRRCSSRSAVRGPGDAGASCGDRAQQRRHLHGHHRSRQRRSQAFSRHDRQCRHRLAKRDGVLRVSERRLPLQAARGRGSDNAGGDRQARGDGSGRMVERLKSELDLTAEQEKARQGNARQARPGDARQRARRLHASAAGSRRHAPAHWRRASIRRSLRCCTESSGRAYEKWKKGREQDTPGTLLGRRRERRSRAPHDPHRPFRRPGHRDRRRRTEGGRSASSSVARESRSHDRAAMRAVAPPRAADPRRRASRKPIASAIRP